jgi:hypothetical protein
MSIFIELKSAGVVAEIAADGRIFTNDISSGLNNHELQHVRIQINSTRSLGSIKQAIKKLEAASEIKEKK